MTHVDPFIRLEGVPGVLENILDHLDHKSLRNTHQVCRQWNETIKRGLSWRRQLQRKTTSKLYWKEVSLQLSGVMDDEVASADCPAKKQFATIFKAIKRLKKNWRTGRCAKKREIPINVEYDLHDSCTSDYLTMDSNSIVIGSPLGHIQVINRRTLTHEMDIFHEKGLQYLKFEGDYLISASFSKLNIWSKATKQLLNTFKLNLTTEAPISSVEFCSGGGLFLSWSDSGSISSDRLYVNSRITIWKLKPLTENAVQPSEMFQLVHNQTLALSRYTASKVLVSEKYIIGFLKRSLPASAVEKYELIIQVLSTIDCSVVYSVKERTDAYGAFSFVNDILVVQIDQPPTHGKIKIIDCEQRTSRDISQVQDEQLFLKTNSRFGIVANYIREGQDFFGEVFELKDIFSSGPQATERFRHWPPAIIPSLEVSLGRYYEDVEDFIMDELSLLQFKRFKDSRTGQITCYLLLFDFLEPFIPSCSYCEKTTHDVKRCSKCKQVHYCSIECQRADWNKEHKSVCSFFSSMTYFE